MERSNEERRGEKITAEAAELPQRERRRGRRNPRPTREDGVWGTRVGEEGGETQDPHAKTACGAPA